MLTILLPTFTGRGFDPVDNGDPATLKLHYDGRKPEALGHLRCLPDEGTILKQEAQGCVRQGYDQVRILRTKGE